MTLYRQGRAFPAGTYSLIVGQEGIEDTCAFSIPDSGIATSACGIALRPESGPESLLFAGPVLSLIPITLFVGESLLVDTLLPSVYPPRASECDCPGFPSAQLALP